ncbi:MAG: hypothetical protein C0404_05200 [Verrucomicrobia bacterium]|nr:hypothetical protein [Verrucomicrobiota bacterium]
MAMAAAGQSVPAVINYQGTLCDSNGNPLAEGNYEIAFRVWGQASGGATSIWGRIHQVYVKNGQFSALLGDGGSPALNPPAITGNLLDAFYSQPRYLGLTVVTRLGIPVASPVELSPRQQITSVPFALHTETAVYATNALSATRATSATDAQWATNVVATGDGVPPGSIMAYAGTNVPSGWLLCNGAAVSRVAYTNLFATLGTNYGAGDGSTTFNLPNMKTRLASGMDTGDASFTALGRTGGAKTNVLAVTNMPTHAHLVTTPATNVTVAAGGAHTHDYQVSDDTPFGGWAQWPDTVDGGAGQLLTKPTDASGSHTHTVDIPPSTSGPAGGNGAHNNIQPYVVVNYIVKY